MLFWLSGLLHLLAGAETSTSPWVNDSATIPDEVWELVFSVAGLAANCQTLPLVSHNFLRLSSPVLLSLYGVQVGGKTYPHYSKIAYEFDRLVTEIGQSIHVYEDRHVFMRSKDCQCAKSILEAAFGRCIVNPRFNAPTFQLEELVLDTFNDARRVSIVPYLFNRVNGSKPPIQYIMELARRHRFDLLELMAIPELEVQEVFLLAYERAPPGVIQAATRSMGKEDRDMLAFKGVGDGTAAVCPGSRVPLCVLLCLHQQQLKLPANCILVGGLKEASILFWFHVIENEATDLLELLRQMGDAESQVIGRALEEPVDPAQMTLSQFNVYQAVILRLFCSPMCNEHVVQNYVSMMLKQQFGYLGLCTLVECGLDDMFKWSNFSEYDIPSADLAAFIYDASRLHQLDLVSVCAKLLVKKQDVTQLVKSLIQRGAEDWYIQSFLDALRESEPRGLFSPYCFWAPLGVLKRLALEPNLLLAQVQEMLTEVGECQYNGEGMTRSIHILYMLMFWEAPEKVLAHYWVLIPEGVVIPFEMISQSLLSAKYSAKFITTRIELCGTLTWTMKHTVVEFRPDVAKELKCYQRLMDEREAFA